MGELSKENGISLEQMKLFFYSVYEYQWNDKTNAWEEIKPEESFVTNVVMPKKATLQGFDVTSYSAQNCAECSPLSCNRMADELTVSSHCLIGSFEEAKKLVETGTFNACEPGPYRIFEVYSVEDA